MKPIRIIGKLSVAQVSERGYKYCVICSSEDCTSYYAYLYKLEHAVELLSTMMSYETIVKSIIVKI